MAPLREEYARLLRTPRRSLEEVRRLAEIRLLLEAPLPPPGELASEREAAKQGQPQDELKLLDDLMAQMNIAKLDEEEAHPALHSAGAPAPKDSSTLP